MELFSGKFEKAVRDIFKNKNVTIIATVPLKGKINLVEQLKQNEGCHLFTVSIFIRTSHMFNNILYVAGKFH